MTSALSARNPESPAGRLDVDALRRDFPAIGQEIAPGVPLAYLDSAATALKPWPVIRAVQAYDAEYPANVHRGLHTLSERATDAFEGARSKVARFLAASDDEIVFTRGTTESINLVARSWGAANLKPGDEILLTLLEHHANLVPWQMLAKERGLILKFAPIFDDGRLDGDAFADLLGDKTRLVAITAMSNVLGTIPPVADLIAMARKRGAIVVLDAAQSVAHGPTSVRDLDADFVAFSGHKMYGPTGIGVLYGRRALLEAMPPMFGGGSMVTRVTLQGAEWNDIPWKFEAGTPPIAQAIGLGAAVDYLAGIGLDTIHAHEMELLRYAHERLDRVEGARILGPSPEHKGAILALEVRDVHPHDLAQLLDRHGVAIRAGHHCAMPLHDRLGLMASARASLAAYNTPEEIDRLAMAIEDARRTMTRRQPARREPTP
ncbi:MAG: cysteine desulfurase [Isosphaeraceae bacterium]